MAEVIEQETSQAPARGLALRAALAVAPAVALAAACIGAVVAFAPERLLGLALLIAGYFATPVAKEAWLAIAPWKMGIPAPLAFVTLLAFEAFLVLLVVRALPVDLLSRRVQRARTMRERLGRHADRWWARVLAWPADFALARTQRALALRDRVGGSRVARRSLALALALTLALPFHSGGAILGTATGRSLGLSRVSTFFAVIAAATWRLGVATLVALAIV